MCLLNNMWCLVTCINGLDTQDFWAFLFQHRRSFSACHAGRICWSIYWKCTLKCLCQFLYFLMSIPVLCNDILIVYYSKNTCISLAYLDALVLAKTPVLPPVWGRQYFPYSSSLLHVMAIRISLKLIPKSWIVTVHVLEE